MTPKIVKREVDNPVWKVGSVKLVCSIIREGADPKIQRPNMVHKTGSGKLIDSGAFILSPLCRNEGASYNVCEAPLALPCVRSKELRCKNLERGTTICSGPSREGLSWPLRQRCSDGGFTCVQLPEMGARAP